MQKRIENSFFLVKDIRKGCQWHYTWYMFWIISDVPFSANMFQALYMLGNLPSSQKRGDFCVQFQPSILRNFPIFFRSCVPNFSLIIRLFSWGNMTKFIFNYKGMSSYYCYNCFLCDVSFSNTCFFTICFVTHLRSLRNWISELWQLK